MSFELTQESGAGQQILTHSRMSCFRDCPRKHYLRYELGLSADIESTPIKFGNALHRAIEIYDPARGAIATVDEATRDMDDPFLRVAARETALAYFARYEGNGLQFVANELPFDLPLVNPATDRATPTFRLQGKIDAIVQLPDGRLALLETKTTTRDFSPGSEYWQRLHMDMQLSIYVIAARALGIEIDTVLYNVIRRPGLKPLKATPEESRKYKQDGTLYANQRDRDETPEEYAERIRADIESRPDYYFARIEIARLEQDLDDCRAEIWQQQLAIREAQKAARWYRNPSSCYGFYKCDYLPICQFRDLETRTPDGFIRREEIHPELVVDASAEG